MCRHLIGPSSVPPFGILREVLIPCFSTFSERPRMYLEGLLNGAQHNWIQVFDQPVNTEIASTRQPTQSRVLEASGVHWTWAWKGPPNPRMLVFGVLYDPKG